MSSKFMEWVRQDAALADYEEEEKEEEDAKLRERIKKAARLKIIATKIHNDLIIEKNGEMNYVEKINKIRMFLDIIEPLMTADDMVDWTPGRDYGEGMKMTTTYKLGKYFYTRDICQKMKEVLGVPFKRRDLNELLGEMYHVIEKIPGRKFFRRERDGAEFYIATWMIATWKRIYSKEVEINELNELLKDSNLFI